LLGSSCTRTCSMFACFASRIDHVNKHLMFRAIFLVLHIFPFCFAYVDGVIYYPMIS
jgi:hypothetical protein